jgi:hypothetical protein
MIPFENTMDLVQTLAAEWLKMPLSSSLCQQSMMHWLKLRREHKQLLLQLRDGKAQVNDMKSQMDRMYLEFMNKEEEKLHVLKELVSCHNEEHVYTQLVTPTSSAEPSEILDLLHHEFEARQASREMLGKLDEDRKDIEKQTQQIHQAIDKCIQYVHQLKQVSLFFLTPSQHLFMIT